MRCIFRWFCLWACLMGLRLGVTVPYANAETPPSEYLRAVQAALDAVEQNDLPKAADALAANTANSELITALRDETISQDEARTQLMALRDAIQAHPPQTSATDRNKLHDLLSQPPFVGKQPTPFEQWLNGVLGSLFGGIANGLVNAQKLFIAIAIVIIAIVLFIFIRNFRATLMRQADLPETHDDDVPATSSAALSRAQVLAGSGDYRTAVRQLYLATLLMLDEQGKLRFDRSLTNRETLRALTKAGAPALADALRPIVEQYDRVWYGFGRIESDEFERYRERVEAVRLA